MEWRKLILPKAGFKYDPGIHARIYFLAGPIRGGGDWQSVAINTIKDADPDSYIVCPYRYPVDHPTAWFAVKSDVGLSTHQIEFESQTLWERFYLDLASKYGCIIFWLPVEDIYNPRPKESGPYARDTLGELGRWSVRSAIQGAKVVVGADSRFSGLSVIQKNFDGDHGRGFQIHRFLNETIIAGIAIAKKNSISI